ncbi:MAG: glycine cleavage system protein H [Gammaproteobacteria bacterium CG_4_10_14_0_8_um_filter_38_16]|nr:MAG: glycine cleavage system protein H [Gammaproteobacteria bacterium CG_4_10_14_0_8_um_filter_38_16]PJA03895.1 MAG: glycine cleavage system protein H [Gammaproteobacteria bacterium CG_4_10_14_0_2_um_filter_38_22]PJB09564.1 MAG: glycine cleavage system protein H [Gammaproteobacteria bacterium CG_4_9_14_3_um_filter_38_9]
MSDYPRELHYSDSHEWVRLESDDTVVVGITDHAQHQLGDLVFVELPDVQSGLEKGDELSVVESVKTAADVYAPISGTVIAVNQQLESRPELINQDPYGDGWICRIKPEDLNEMDELMDADAYQASVSDTNE